MAETGILGDKIRTSDVDFTAHGAERTQVQGHGMPESHKVRIQMTPTLECLFIPPRLEESSPSPFYK